MLMINKLFVLALLFTTSICSASSNNQQRLSELCQEAFGMMTDRYGGGVQCFVERAGTLKGFSVHSIMDLEAVVKDIKAKKAEIERKLAEKKEQHRKQLEKKRREIELRDQKIQTDKENRIKSNSHRKYAGVIMGTKPKDNEILVNSKLGDLNNPTRYKFAGLNARVRTDRDGLINSIFVSDVTTKDKIKAIEASIKQKYELIPSSARSVSIEVDSTTSKRLHTHKYLNDGDQIWVDVYHYYSVPKILQSTNKPYKYSIDVLYRDKQLVQELELRRQRQQNELNAKKAKEKQELSGF